MELSGKPGNRVWYLERFSAPVLDRPEWKARYLPVTVDGSVESQILN